MKPLEKLLAVMDRLRDPKTGCPWDREQDFATIAPYTIEEAYEVADAIAQDDFDALKDELGDLLFQIVFHARLAKERDAFDFEAVADHIAEKMIRRHPHVFAGAEISDVEAQTLSWEAQKAAERAEKAKRTGAPPGLLDGIPLALPALSRAAKLQKRAARVGFDWPELAPVLAKLDEELAEVNVEIDHEPPRSGPPRGRDRRSALRRGQPRAPSGDRPGNRAAPDQRQVRAPLSRHRGRIRRPWTRIPPRRPSTNSTPPGNAPRKRKRRISAKFGSNHPIFANPRPRAAADAASACATPERERPAERQLERNTLIYLESPGFR